MGIFEEQMFNPQYMNPDYYKDNHAMLQNCAKEQSDHVIKAVHAFTDMMDEIQKMDKAHQEQTFSLCYYELAKRNGWLK